VTEIIFNVSPELVDVIAERAAALLSERMPATAARSPYMNVEEAADYLRCKPQRIYDLLSSGRLTRHKDGSRTLVGREELERYLRGLA
jgi:excisionase family DNA binding protein